MASKATGSDATFVLVASDDPVIRDEALFGFPEGYAIELAWDAREALQVMHTRIPSAVVVDLQTGSAGGYALAKEMAEQPRLSDVPVLVLLERDQDAWLASQSGAAAFRVKPIDVSTLVADTLALIPTSRSG